MPSVRCQRRKTRRTGFDIGAQIVLACNVNAPHRQQAIHRKIVVVEKLQQGRCSLAVIACEVFGQCSCIQYIGTLSFIAGVCIEVSALKILRQAGLIESLAVPEDHAQPGDFVDTRSRQYLGRRERIVQGDLHHRRAHVDRLRVEARHDWMHHAAGAPRHYRDTTHQAEPVVVAESRTSQSFCPAGRGNWRVGVIHFALPSNVQVSPTMKLRDAPALSWFWVLAE